MHLDSKHCDYFKRIISHLISHATVDLEEQSASMCVADGMVKPHLARL